MSPEASDPADSVPRIRLREVAKRFGDRQVLDGVDLDIAAGESMVVVGPSGTGKSVTLRCILGLDHPDAGDIAVDGVSLDARGILALRRRSGVLFQGGALFDSLPVWRNVAFRLLHEGMRSDQARAAATECLRLVELEASAGDLLPAGLSGGMRKRVALARAIAASPEILFIDEPTAGLDPILATVVSQLLRRLVTEIGATAFTITHDLDSARIVGDRVAMLYGGRIRWVGPVAELGASGDPHVEQFVAGAIDGPIETLR